MNKKVIRVFAILLILTSCNVKDNKTLTIQDSINISHEFIDSGNIARKNKNFEKSIEFYRRANIYDRQSYEPIFLIANVYLNKGKYPIVIEICESIEKWYTQDDNFFMVFDIKSQALHKLKRNNEALLYASKVIECILNRGIDKKMEESLLSWFYSDRARILYDLNKDEEALSNIEKSLELDNFNSDAIFCKGLIELKAGRKLKACECFESSAKLEQEEAKKYFIDTCSKVE
jgi:tetratricopeptide (TPR) repeat protein